MNMSSGQTINTQTLSQGLAAKSAALGNNRVTESQIMPEAKAALSTPPLATNNRGMTEIARG